MTINTMSAEEFRQLADLLFPDVTETPSEIEAKYPERQLAEGALVSRFAPSPTGFIHIGGIFAGLLNKMLTTATDGVYILRVEDTDQNREIERGLEQIVSALNAVELTPDEGPYTVDPVDVRGDYGPYIQSQRLHLYQAYIKDMVARGKAYPDFTDAKELNEIRDQQQKQNTRPGIYGVWARGRNLTFQDIQAKLEAGDEFVIRLKAEGSQDNKITIHDRIRDRLDLPENDIDSVLLKSDGFPTYNFAHIIDDYLMRVNLVLRGDEYLPSIPLYVQIHEYLGFDMPDYAHFAPIAKMDGNSRRKLSKRKDPEAAMSYYYEKGYPTQALLEYLLNLANSTFEDWRVENPNIPYIEFPFDIDRLGRASSLFDMEKLTSVSKEIIASYTAQQVYEEILKWAQEYNESDVALLNADPEYTIRVFDIERGGDKPRKDLSKWDEWREYYGVLFDEIYDTQIPAGYTDAPQIKKSDLVDLLNYLIDTTDQTMSEDKMDWIQRMRDYTADNGYANRRKDYKNNPAEYKGWFGDIMMAFRVALTGKTQTPDLYEMVQVMGAERAKARFKTARDFFASAE